MIVILDFGGQYCHLIARRIRELGVYSEVLPFDASAEQIKGLKAEGIIFSGGPNSVYDKNAPFCDEAVFRLNIPILGICYGHQLIAKFSGGEVKRGKPEYGSELINVAEGNSLFTGLSPEEAVWMSHGDSVVELPRKFKAIALSSSEQIAAFENEIDKLYGVQFHPEVEHTENGMKILQNFLEICNAKRDYSFADMDIKLIERVREKIGDKAVIMAVSGGVDSLVASVLINSATDRLHCVFIDNGLLRKNEVSYVEELFNKMGFENFQLVDASSLFLERLKGITDPEQKRKIIGNAFIEVFEKKAEELKEKFDIGFLGQGTIYPDRIESAKPSKSASVIKTHHNVGGLPEKMKLKLVEPLQDLYKDEVRKLGSMLGIDEEFLSRHPFPGPGLAVRIIGEVTKEKLEILREADDIFISELKNSGYYEKVWQALAALLPVKTVGVMGDERTYEHMIALRAVTSKDAMTADWAKLPYYLLEKISGRIINEVKGINRVVYDISQKPPATIEYE